MADELVLFKTAELARKKGFDIECTCAISAKTKDIVVCSSIKSSNSQWAKASTDEYPDLIALPTQCSLQRWLREKHYIHISPQLSRNEDEEYKDWWFYLYPKPGGCRRKFFPDEIGSGLSFEKMLDIALQEALTLIK